MGRGALEHFPVKWFRFTVENAAEEEEHFPVKWFRFTVKNAAQTRTTVWIRARRNGSSLVTYRHY
jgi:hypothetical protein